MSELLDYYSGEGTGIGGGSVPSYDYSTTANTGAALSNSTLAAWNIEPSTNATGFSVMQNPAMAAVGVNFAANLGNVFSLWAAKQAGVLPQAQGAMQTASGAQPLTVAQKNTQMLIFAGIAFAAILILKD